MSGHNHDHHNHGSHGITSSTMDPMMSHDGHENLDASGSGGGHHNMMMHMYFHGGLKETILFEFWETTDVAGMIASIIAIFFLAFFYEALKFYREHLYRHSFQTVQLNTISVPVENGGSMKETQKTVHQVANIPLASHPYATPDVRPIFLTQVSCPCPGPNRNDEQHVDAAPRTVENSKDNILSSGPGASSMTTVIVPPSQTFHYKVKMFSKMHLWQTCLHVIQIVISYFLMLIFMTYNVWLCLAVTVGAGTGYFFFGWKKSLVVDITEHCH